MNDRAPVAPQRPPPLIVPAVRAPAPPQPRHAWGSGMETDAAPSRFAHDFSGVRLRAPAGSLQAKLVVGPPGDAYEQEADRVAAAVMDGSAGPRIASSTPEDRVQRLCPHCSAPAAAQEQDEDDATPVHA
ncbi:MAG TPA: hypothetical protein VFY65_09060 [Longimicrobium sp.]|nr:hypothetical protein [Longimicrobium sp.]